MRTRSGGTIQRRITVVLLFFCVAIVALVAQLFTIQIFHHRDYAKLASQQHSIVEDVFSDRGTIFMQDKNGSLIPVALNKIEKTLVASPQTVSDPDGAAAILASLFSLDAPVTRAKLSQPQDPYEILLKGVDADYADQVAARLPKGVFFEEDKRRVYPHGEFAANLIGFTSKELDTEIGKYGVERSYNSDLAGEKGLFEGVKDAAGFWVALGKQIINPPKNGSSVVLTLDYNIQLKAEEVLKSVREKWRAASGSVLVVDPKTGRILALAGDPSFDPNAYGQVRDFSFFLNPLTESTYELGSVMKPVTMAGAIEDGVVTSTTTYNDTGEAKIGGYTVRNFDGQAYHTQTMSQVIEKSLNVGMVHVAQLLGKASELAYIKKFGFGAVSGIDLPGEVVGNISNLNNGRDIDYATAAFGQGIAVTPLQLAMAVGALANNGNLMRPYAVDKVVEDSGNEVVHAPETVRSVVSPKTAETLTKMLISAVQNGFENRAGVQGYFVAGKTGTAQIPNPNGRGYSDDVMHSFIGYAPAFNPKFLIFFQMNRPQGNRFASNTLTPAFHDLAQFILNYYEVPPDEKR